MHGHGENSVGVFILGVFTCAIIWALLSIFWTWIRGLFEVTEPPEITDEEAEVNHAIALLTKARPAPGGKWVNFRVSLQECEAPIERSNFVVHDRTDPQHVKQCAECREGVAPRYSGVSHRSN